MAECEKRSADRARALAASVSRSRGGALVTSESSNSRAAAVTWSTARLNAGSFAFDGLVNPLTLRTNCSADARTSSSVAAGSKLKSGLILRHIEISFQFPVPSFQFPARLPGDVCFARAGHQIGFF